MRRDRWTRRAARGWLIVLMGAGFAAACRDPGRLEEAGGRRGAAPSGAGPLRGAGERGIYAFELALDPGPPALGELFHVVTTVRDARTGAPVEGAEVVLDAAMPEHDHGMTTSPRHRELGGGRYLSEGMKLHMPGAWEFDARARKGVEDRARIPYDARPSAPR
ncbi:FixH family protein [Sorangium sp. So ce854]|uniref:FixH family protein n=1 Tax=Sorangium sp. So ce854 TaxID=3133322 RepID=UPI003F61CA08